MTAWAEWIRAGGLARRVAVWTSAAALLGVVAFAAAVYSLLLFEARESASADQEGAETPEAELAEEIGWAVLIAAPPSLLLAVGGATWASRRAFRPLQAVTRAANEITTASLGRRLEVGETDRDLEALVRAFNELLGRLDHGVEALDRYAADVSHEIRTPLAVAITELEVALRQPRSEEQWRAQAGRTLEDLRGLGALADALLELARTSTGAGLPRERVRLAEALRPVLERASAKAAEVGLELTVRGVEDSACSVAGSEPLLRGALANLVDNALEHAGTPGRVAVTLERGGAGVRILVEDDGAGVPEGERERVFEPFVRGSRADESRPGFGLGLALARRAVVAHGGTIEVGESAWGGAAFTIELPTASPP